MAGPGITDSSAGNVRAAVEGFLKRLGTDYIDFYYCSAALPAEALILLLALQLRLLALQLRLLVGFTHLGDERLAPGH